MDTEMKKILAILDKVASGVEITDGDKVEIFKGMARRDPFGAQLREAYGSIQGQLLLPLMRQESFIRRIFTENFTNGQQIEFPIRSKRIRAGWYGADRSHTPQRFATSDSIYIHTFPIQGGVSWDLDQIKTGNYNIVEQLQNDMVDEIVYKEEYAGWALIKAAFNYGDIESIATLTTGNSLITDNRQGSNFSIYVFNEILTTADLKPDGGREITDMFMTPRRHGDMKSWVTTVLQDLPEQTRASMFNAGGNMNAQGVYGVAFHKVRDAEFVDDTKLWAFGNNFGVMAVDERWHTINDPMAIMRWRQGIIGREKVGFGITDVESAVVYNF